MDMPSFEELVRRLEMVERKLSVPVPRTTCLGSAEATVAAQLDIQHSASAQGAFVTTELEKGVDGEWHYRGRPAHQVVIRAFLDGLKPGVVLRVLAPTKGDKP
jgi:hypothetical protein